MDLTMLQQITDLAGSVLMYSVPIGVVFGLAEKACNLFFSMAFGDKRVRM